MVDVGDIKPAGPVEPARPIEKPKPAQPGSRDGRRERRAPRNEDDSRPGPGGEDGRIDEYA